MSTEKNIYEAPECDLAAAESEQVNTEPASAWLRFANMIIDYLAYIGLIFVFGIIMYLIFGEQVDAIFDNIPEFLFGLPFYLGYYLVMESTTNRTIGKLITGTKVVNEEGYKPTFKQILGRTFSRLIPFEAFTFLGDPVGWHDSLPKTYVVKCRR